MLLYKGQQRRLLDKLSKQGIKWEKGTSSTGALHYCFSKLTDKDLDFFGKLPVSEEIILEECEPLSACHGSPQKNNEKLLTNKKTHGIF